MIHENARRDGNISHIDVEFVEFGAAQLLPMNFRIQLHLVRNSFWNTVLIIDTFCHGLLAQTVTIGLTKPIYSPDLVDLRIILRLTKL